MVRIEITDTRGIKNTYEKIIRFNFTKEYYTPYTALSAVFISNVSITAPVEVSFYIDNKLIHHGIIDSLDSKKNNKGYYMLTVVSKGFTSMLTQNNLMSGIYSNVSLNNLFNDYISITNVEHEDSSAAENYIYVKDNSSMWDVIANLCYKQKTFYPYIEGTNTVRISKKANPILTAIPENKLISQGVVNNYLKMVSKLYMKNAEGSYFELENIAVKNRMITRQKYLDIDKQYLSPPTLALDYRMALSMSGYYASYAEYKGYSGEDLMDTINIDGQASMGRIAKIKISGDKNGITTKSYVYSDLFL